MEKHGQELWVAIGWITYSKYCEWFLPTWSYRKNKIQEVGRGKLPWRPLMQPIARNMKRNKEKLVGFIIIVIMEYL